MKKLQVGLWSLLLAALALAGCSRSTEATKPDDIQSLPDKDAIKKKDGIQKAPVPGK
jgi:hypothetical protein